MIHASGTINRRGQWIALAILAVIFCSGCSRRAYRLQADRDAEQLISERVSAEYFLPDRPVQAASHSRMADLSNPDCGPLPPDDSAASIYMNDPYRSHGSRVWQKRGSLPDVEFDHWKSALPADGDGVVTLSRRTSMELALLHSREYQTAVEDVYLTALPVSLERFRFDTQWVGGAGVEATRTGLGKVPAGSRSLSVTDSLGFSRRFASGGQLLADFSNAMVWEFSSGQSSVSSVLSFQFLQPLMRRAFREVQLESLTQSERRLLYSVRDFARFRQTFYVNTIGTDGYLGLLGVVQAIRNQESNLQSLRRNLQEHEALAAAGLVSQFQVDQVYQDYEQGRLSLLSAVQAYGNAMGRFRIQLGLPPSLSTKLDDSELKLFELNDSRLDELTRRNDDLRIRLLQYDEKVLPAAEELSAFLQEVADLGRQTMPLIELVGADMARWLEQLESEQAKIRTLDDDDERISEFERRMNLADRLRQMMADIGEQAAVEQTLLNNSSSAIKQDDRLLALNNLVQLTGEILRQRLADLFVVQTQVRVFMVEVKPLEIREETAVWIALQNRLDLRNQLAQVVDAYRRTEVNADLLEADLDLVLNADIGTDPGKRNPVRFDQSASRFSAGLQFDGPLNRMAERNVWRASQIAYQQARRDFMEARDGIVFEVGVNLRRLELDRFQFEITRQQLITAARQVEEAQLKLRNSTEPDSNLTRDLLTALQSLLRARNSLIGSWVSYETSRMELYRTLGMLFIDDQGGWMNDGQTFDSMILESGEGIEELREAPEEQEVELPETASVRTSNRLRTEHGTFRLIAHNRV